ncbi:MAG: GlmU family protein [Flavobacteriales bacterium]|nr:GlmU family protein [Flavobacteriales bacterium]MCB9166582.1 GlmU family protein [Flavobacteriales bacterium]
MALLLSDAGLHAQLLPLTFTRPIGAMRPGVLTLADAWWRMTELPVGFRTQEYLQERYPVVAGAEMVREVRGSLLPLPDLVSAVLDLAPGQVLVKDGVVLAFCHTSGSVPTELDWVTPPAFLDRITYGGDLVRYERPWDLFRHCGEAVINDMALLTEGRRSAPLSALNTVIGDPALIFLEEGAKVEAAVLNTTKGPIHVGRDAEIMEGCLVRGPFALGADAQLKMGARIYGPTAIGPGSRIGGEVNNSVVFGHSNKAHDGFLGNSVLGEWCNLGADTNNSNLKNTYGEVKLWSYAERQSIGTGLQFCGLIMGDHSKTGINTMFNTGTVVGVCTNVFGAGFPSKHLPSFVWGGSEGLAEHELDKALAVAERVMARRHVELDPVQRAILTHVRDMSAVDRVAT